MPELVRIFEMAPRDGLQNEPAAIATVKKIKLVDLLSQCGFAKIECASFVSPKRVPQMADGAEVLAGIQRRPGIAYAALTPNLIGYDRAVAAGADEVAIFASASEGFSQANINCSIAESLKRFEPVAARAAEDNIRVRGYVSCVTDCPYDGPTPPQNVAAVASDLRAMGCYEISLGDTIGRGTPQTITAMLEAVLESVPVRELAGHYHDTGNRAADNVVASLKLGLRSFDAAAGGLGGCPFAPGAKGNVATETVIDVVETRGFTTGIDRQKLAIAAEFARSLRSPRP
jgi:hydroxymethylglutaryl-CoA lyase